MVCRGRGSEVDRVSLNDCVKDYDIKVRSQLFVSSNSCKYPRGWLDTPANTRLQRCARDE
jgi:hypothetical protein